MGWPAAHALPLSCGRIACAHPSADIDIAQALLPQHRTDAGQRSVEIFADVVRQRLQWGDVDDLGLVPQRAVKSLAHQIVDRRHEGSQCLAGTGRGGNQHIAPGLDGGPGLRLRGSRPTEATLEPGGDGGMEQRRRNSWTGTVPHSFAGKRPEVRNEARGQIMDKLVEIWDQLTLNQRSCPVDRKGRLETRPFVSDVELSCAGATRSPPRRTHGQADELRKQNTGRSPKAYTDPANAELRRRSLLRLNCDLVPRMSTILYFAYGSNMYAARLRYRVPSCRFRFYCAVIEASALFSQA